MTDQSTNYRPTDLAAAPASAFLTHLRAGLTVSPAFLSCLPGCVLAGAAQEFRKRVATRSGLQGTADWTACKDDTRLGRQLFRRCVQHWPEGSCTWLRILSYYLRALSCLQILCRLPAGPAPTRASTPAPTHRACRQWRLRSAASLVLRLQRWSLVRKPHLF